MARQLRGLTMASLSAEARVSTRMLSNYENGKTVPESDTVARLAETLCVAPGFFYRPEPPAIEAEAVSFRSLTKTPAKQRHATRSASALAVELDSWISNRFSRPEVDVPDLDDMPPSVAAASLRAEWGMGVKPVRHLTHLLEARGVRVYSFGTDVALGAEARNIDGLSFWFEGVPFILLGTEGTAERRRMSMAHELGHLVLHQHGAIAGRGAEREANAFAGHFIVPTEDLVANAPRNRLRSIIEAKKRWGVSALGLVYRMYEVGMLSEWEYRRMCIKLRSEFGSTEPSGGRPEVSQVLPKVLEALRQDGVGRHHLARDLGVSPTDVDGVLRSITLLPLSGSAGVDTSTPHGLLKLEK